MHFSRYLFEIIITIVFIYLLLKKIKYKTTYVQLVIILSINELLIQSLANVAK